MVSAAAGPPAVQLEMINRDEETDFTDAFCAFLQTTITTVDAAEVLLALRASPETEWSLAELAARLRSGGGSLSEVELAKYVDALSQRGLVSRTNDGRVRYAAPAELDDHVVTLTRLYAQRPVTLFRVIYALRDQKIKTLADAFRIWSK